MSDNLLTYEELVGEGWTLNPRKGVETAGFVSLSFHLVRDGRSIKYVQGYGRTFDGALDDAVREANAWLKAERIVEFHRESASPSRAGRRRR